ncbi:MAG: hypothetical protein M3Y86_08635 [Verrucomicrobiota bacterium]|nr:hypothetical protein [Verrucomicrobiota bacterium]
MIGSHYLRGLLRAVGVDRPVAYTIAARVWAAVAGPVTLFFVVRYLTSQEQGFYYTFGSILGLQVFFEIGLASVVGLSASHERAKLDWSNEGTLEGDPLAKARLASIFKTGSRWYLAISAIFVAIVLPFGLLFFAKHQPTELQVSWRGPWLSVVVVQAANLAITPLLALLEGCGLVGEVALVHIWRTIIGSVLSWALLLLHWKLFVAPVFNCVSLLCTLTWIALYKRAFLLNLLRTKTIEGALEWSKEVWPFQWKMALSSISGYFIFLCFNPVLFAYHGAAAAGQMGMTLSIMGTLSATASAWIATKAAPFGTLVARRQFGTLDRMFFLALRQSTILITLGGIAFWAAAYFLRLVKHPIGERLLSPVPLALLVATAVISHVVTAEAVYLRSYKREPFLLISILIAGLTAGSTYLLGVPFGATGMMAGYSVIYLVVGLGGGTWIFHHRRKLWTKSLEDPDLPPTGLVTPAPLASPLDRD